MFISLLIIFVLNQIVGQTPLRLLFIRSYLDDLLCFPIVLTIVILAHRNLRPNNREYVLPVSHIILSVFLFSLLFEVVLPKVHSKFTGDVFDILAYIVGAFFFHKTLNVLHGT